MLIIGSGDHDGLQGPGLDGKNGKTCAKYNVNIIFDHINKVDFKNKPLSLEGDDGNKYPQMQ